MGDPVTVPERVHSQAVCFLFYHFLCSGREKDRVFSSALICVSAWEQTLVVCVFFSVIVQEQGRSM